MFVTVQYPDRLPDINLLNIFGMVLTIRKFGRFGRHATWNMSQTIRSRKEYPDGYFERPSKFPNCFSSFISN